MANLFDLDSLLDPGGLDKAVKMGGGQETAYEKKKPFSNWWNYLLGPSGYSGGINWNSINPGPSLVEPWFRGDWYGGLTAKDTREGIDWGKQLGGAKYGMNIGGSLSPGWGHAIGAGVGAGVGGMLVDEQGYDKGLAAGATGNATGNYEWANDVLPAIGNIASLYGAYSGGGGSAGATKYMQYLPAIANIVGDYGLNNNPKSSSKLGYGGLFSMLKGIFG